MIESEIARNEELCRYERKVTTKDPCRHGIRDRPCAISSYSRDPRHDELIQNSHHEVGWSAKLQYVASVSFWNTGMPRHDGAQEA